MSADGDCIHAIIWGQQVGDGHQEECCCWWRGRYSGWTPTSTCTHMKSKAKTKTRTATSSSTWFADLKSKTKTKNKKGGTKVPHDWKVQLITTPSNLSIHGSKSCPSYLQCGVFQIDALIIYGELKRKNLRENKLGSSMLKFILWCQNDCLDLDFSSRSEYRASNEPCRASSLFKTSD